MSANHTEYHYTSADAAYEAGYLVEPVKALLEERVIAGSPLFELGCGNGVNANEFAKQGYQVSAVDTSESGIAAAKEAYQNCHFETGSAYDDLAAKFGKFPCVVSLEVVEHVFAPRDYARTVYELLQADGMAIISTPYHGYFKNLAIALLNKFDDHVNPLWDGGHIKFWSQITLNQLLLEAGFKTVEYKLVGRIPWLAKSMIAIAQK